MNTAEWIIVAILSATLFIFLVVAIILVVKLIQLTNSAKEVVAKGSNLADNAADMVSRASALSTVSGAAKAFTAVSGLAKSVFGGYNKNQKSSPDSQDN